MKISKNFHDYEFKNIKPDLNLLTLLQATRDAIDCPIKITDSIRTIQDHIEIYKKIYKDDWFEKIPWGSRHLPCWETPNLRAVDIKAKKKDGSYWKGGILAEAVKEEAKTLNIHIGLGVGKEFLHIDVDRKQFTTWNYTY